VTVDAPPDFTTSQVWRYASKRWTLLAKPDLSGFEFARDERGSLWIATASSAARHDGRRWTEFPALHSGRFWSMVRMAVGPDATVWHVGVDESDELVWHRFSGGKWTAMNVLSRNELDRECVRRRSRAWGLKNTPTRSELDGVEMASAVNSIAVARDGSLWAAVDCIGVLNFDPHTSRSTLYAKGPPPPDPELIDVAPDGTVWVADSRGIAHQ
jgi:hypothetical protein